MAKKPALAFDEIGYWSEVKLDIIRDYASAYSRIFSAKRQHRFSHVYIDAFAGAGVHVSKTTGDFVPGSPLNALLVSPPFKEFFLIDLDGDKVDNLRRVVGDYPNVHLFHGDCNQVLLNDVFPKVQYADFRRGLCVFDPYGLHLNWEVIARAGSMKTLDIFLNFPIMDMNRNVLWRNPENVAPDDIQRMNAFWGDETWRSSAYTQQPGLFEVLEDKNPNDAIARAFRRRLESQGGFEYVPDPLPMTNSRGAVVYYLFFAAQVPVASDIIEYILSKYRSRRG